MLFHFLIFDFYASCIQHYIKIQIHAEKLQIHVMKNQQGELASGIILLARIS